MGQKFHERNFERSKIYSPKNDHAQRPQALKHSSWFRWDAKTWRFLFGSSSSIRS